MFDHDILDYFDLSSLFQNSSVSAVLTQLFIQPFFDSYRLFDYDIFDEFQWKIFKVLLFIVLINLALIGLFWQIFGDRIIEKFLQPSTSALLIEELKNSISELKLPKEHSPRI